MMNRNATQITPARLVLPTLLLFLLSDFSGCARPDFGLPDLEYGGYSDVVYNRVLPDIVLQDSSGASDIFIGEDGTVYVAETTLNRISVYDIMGQPLLENGLGSLYIDSVLSVSIDRQMNLLAVNGGNEVFLWNKLANALPVDSIWFDFWVRDTTQVDSLLPVDVLSLIAYLDPTSTDDPYILEDYQRAVSPEEIEDQLAMQVHEMSLNTKLIDVAADPDVTQQFFATDYAQSRIFDFHLEAYGIIYTSDVLMPIMLIWRIVPEATRHHNDWGEGFGYPNKPNRIHVDRSGDYYFTNFIWTSNTFQLHKTRRFVIDDTLEYYPDADFLFYDITENPDSIRDVFYNFSTFSSPKSTHPSNLRRSGYVDCWDLSTTSDNIYVVDRGKKAVHVFSSGGTFITYAGATINYTEQGEEYEFDQLVDPISVDFFGGEEVQEDINALLFVLDRGADRIVRYEKTVPEE